MIIKNIGNVYRMEKQKVDRFCPTPIEEKRTFWKIHINLYDITLSRVYTKEFFCSRCKCSLIEHTAANSDNKWYEKLDSCTKCFTDAKYLFDTEQSALREMKNRLQLFYSNLKKLIDKVDEKIIIK